MTWVPERWHPLRAMRGRDPEELHRASTPLELLFDLAFVVAFGLAADQLTERVAAGHLFPGLFVFVAVMVAICWDWMSFSWFASAYDTDDWASRLVTMFQMTGVLVFALGLPEIFSYLDGDGPLDVAVALSGYLAMRTATVAQRIRAGIQDRSRRRQNISSAVPVAVAQLGWVLLVVIAPPPALLAVFGAALFVVELLGPVIAERGSGGTPWNPHHIAERYSLLTIIALGEVVAGTIAAVGALTAGQGWSVQAMLIALLGTALAFGLWWAYFIVPTGELLTVRRSRGTAWGFGHILLFISIAATGAGLHVAARSLEGDTHINTAGTIAAIALPATTFVVALLGIVTLLLGRVRRVFVIHFGSAAAVATISIFLAAVGAPLLLCLAVVTAAPWILVAGHEAMRPESPNAEARLGA